MNILITGGAGYIGSTVANLLLDRKHKVSIIDNLSTGIKKNIPDRSIFYKCDISDKKKVRKILKKKFDVVLHFAAFTNNDESIKKPKKYLINNYKKAKFFLELCIESNIKNFIYSSTAAIYGNNKKRIKENQKTSPLSPYAKSKLKLEKFFFKKKKDINFIILRYFNVGGIEKKLRCGFNINNNTLISNLCRSVINEETFFIYGKSHNTIDGTAIRDYIHVIDLAKIHFEFSKKILKKKYSDVFNCGYGKGISVKKMYNIFSKVSKKSPKVIFKGKRKKDISVSISDITKLSHEIDVNYKKAKWLDLAKTSIDWYRNNKEN
ncbi:UDP-glucose 4-epimerase GalE [Pelagibacterales bacterium SAG-MED11]|nr:UDP-glucose 4-epimerase GalE [Pelagibacterales bacterium SAG-MED11]